MDGPGGTGVEHPIVAQTREALKEELQNHISMLWDEYAVDAESNLSPVALVLRARLQAATEEVPASWRLPDETGKCLRSSVLTRASCRDEFRHCTQECVRHLCFNNLRRDEMTAQKTHIIKACSLTSSTTRSPLPRKWGRSSASAPIASQPAQDHEHADQAEGIGQIKRTGQGRSTEEILGNPDGLPF